MRRGWVIGLMLVGLALLSATPLLAHANLERSDPPVGSILMTAPDIIQLSFTEPLEPRFSGITLLDAGGQLLDLPPSVVSVADPTQMSLLPGDLPDGLYTVSWRVLSSADGHATQGAFTFTIGVAPEGASSVAAASERFAADGVVIRWLNIVSMALVTGGIGFWLFVWTPCAFGAQPAADRRMRWLIWAGWLLLGISGVLALLLQLSTAENVPLLQSLSSPALAEFVSETRYGRLWLVRMGLWLALGVALLLADGTRRWLWTALALSAGILLTNSLYSHASISPDFAAAVAGDWLHLLMTSLWLGGLAQFLNTLAARRVNTPELAATGTMVLHFSNYARIAVAALVVTGLYSAWLQVGSVEALVTTVYGQALLVKLILFLPLLVIAAVNLVYTAKGLRDGQRAWAARLRGLIGVEVTLLLGMLVAVGVMTSVNPARQVVESRQAAPPLAPTAFFEMQVVDDLHAHLGITPGTVGENTFTVTLYDEENNRVTDASLVRLRFENREAGLGESGLRAEPQPDGTYQVVGTNLSVPGTWRVRLMIQRPNKFDSVVDYEPTISPAPAKPADSPAESMPLSQRTLALLLTGLVALIIGGFFVGRSRAPLWHGMGLLASSLVLVGMVFLVSGVLAG